MEPGLARLQVLVVRKSHPGNRGDHPPHGGAVPPDGGGQLEQVDWTIDARAAGAWLVTADGAGRLTVWKDSEYAHAAAHGDDYARGPGGDAHAAPHGHAAAPRPRRTLLLQPPSPARRARPPAARPRTVACGCGCGALALPAARRIVVAATRPPHA